jgi:hypothetical protein
LDINRLCEDLERLVIAPGPTGLLAKMSPDDYRLGAGVEFPLAEIIRRVINDLNREYDTKLIVIEHLGNIIVVNKNLRLQSIEKLPVTLTAHADEITYSVAKKKVNGQTTLVPLFREPDFVVHHNVRAFGLRQLSRGRELIEAARGRIEIREKAGLSSPDIVMEARAWEYEVSRAYTV